MGIKGNFLGHHGEPDRQESTTDLTDYDVYVMSGKERLLYVSLALVVIFVIAYIFYHSLILSVLLTPFSLLYPKYRTQEIISKRKNELNLQFKDMLYSLSSSLVSGRSVESAFKDVLKDLSIIHPDPSTPILTEVECILRKLENNETMETAFSDFAARSHLEDVESFVDVFYTCKRTGGNIVEVIRNTSSIMKDKIEMKQEIITLLAQRKLEHKILSAMPVFLVVILTMSAGDYMEPVFTTLQGRAAMTVAIMLLAAGYFISKKIMDIKV